MGGPVASFCPNCKGLMRPRNGVLECIRCSDSGRARTVVSKGKRIALGQGQVALGGRARESASGFDPALTPKDPDWKPEPEEEAKPHPQLGLFPHDAMRDGQRRFARDTTLAVQRGQHLVAHAPTGIGKTAASLAPALQHALDADKVVLFLTSRQSQHRIAVDTLRQVQQKRGVRFGLVDLVGKRDMCLRPEVNEMHPARFPDFCAAETRTRSCQYLGDVDEDTLRRVRSGVMHVEELMKVAKDAHLCPHLVAMTAAPTSQVVVADYNHLFSDIRDRSLERLGVDLSDVIVIVDEAHNLPDRIRQSHAHRITDFLLDNVRGEARTHRAREVQADCDALREALIELADRADKEGKAEKARFGDDDAQVARLEIDDLHDAFERSRSAGTLGMKRTLTDAIEDLGSLAGKVRKAQDDQVFSEELRETLEDWGRFQSGALRYVEWDDMGGISLHVRLLDPSIPARKVFDQVHSAVLMSGTLRPPEMVRDLLGLEEKRTTVREYPSPFPPEHKVLCVSRGITTRFKDRGPAMWQKIGAAVGDVAASTKGNVAVFAPSYAVLQEVRHATETDKEAVVEEPSLSKGERDRVLDTLQGAKTRGGGILYGVLGGSFAEGVDFRDNLLSAVVVVGLPLAPPDLEVQAAIGYLDKRFPGKGRLYGYVYPAMNKVLQALGRGIRSGSDKCAFLLLDERYLQRPYRDLLPKHPEPLASTDPAFTVASFLTVHDL